MMIAEFEFKFAKRGFLYLSTEVKSELAAHVDARTAISPKTFKPIEYDSTEAAYARTRGKPFLSFIHAVACAAAH
jgi:predicted component of type VI protein secretion system